MRETPLCLSGSPPLQPAEISTFTCPKPFSPGCQEGLVARSACSGARGCHDDCPHLSHLPTTAAVFPCTTDQG